MLESIGNGILTGVVASICFSIIMMLIRPRIKVSPKIAISRGEKSVIKIKVVNKTWSMLTNLQYFLYYCVDYDDGTTDISEIPPLKSKLCSIDKYSLFDKQASYAVRISYELDEKVYPISENVRLSFTILADHAFSNTTTCKKVSYRKKDILEGLFETKKSVSVLINKDG